MRATRNLPICRAIILPFFVESSPTLTEMSALQFSSCIPIFIYLPTNLLVQIYRAFKTRHGLRGIQAASEQKNRHVTCKNKARLHALLHLFSKNARYNPQMLIFAVQNLILHQSKKTFATLGGNHEWQTRCRLQYPPPQSQKPCPYLRHSKHTGIIISGADRKTRRASKNVRTY